MLPVSFRIPHQKRSVVLQSAGNLTESYFGGKKKRERTATTPGFHANV